MFDTYEKARSDAQTKANASGRSYGIERVTMLGKGWRVFMLPNPENRRGHELMCEVVDPEVRRPAGGVK